MDLSPPRPINPSEISLFDPVSPAQSPPPSTSQYSLEEDNKENVGTSYIVHDNREPSPPSLNYWQQMQQPMHYKPMVYDQQAPRNDYAHHNLMFPYYHQAQHQQFLYPPHHQMPLLRQLIQQPTMMPEALRPQYASKPQRAPKSRAPVIRQRPEKLNLAWTYPAMISATLINSRGPQKMDRIYAFMESHFLTRLKKKGNGVNDKDSWRKCIRHTIVYGKQFESIAPEHSPRGKLYLINPAKKDEIMNMFRSKFEELREDMTYPHLLERMLNGELVDSPIEYPPAYYELQDALKSIEETGGGYEEDFSGSLSQPNKMVSRRVKTKKTNAKQEQPVQSNYSELRRLLSTPPLNPLQLEQNQPPSGYEHPPQMNNMDFGQYSNNTATFQPADRVTPVSNSGCDGSAFGLATPLEMSRDPSLSPLRELHRALLVPNAAVLAGTPLPGVDTFTSLQSSLYTGVAPVQNDQFPDDFLQ